jgi:hypothetical protein
MRRRDFISLVGVAVAWPLAARAQQPDRMRLIGVLMAYAESDSTAQSWLAAFRAALAKLGWTEGSNLRIELRWSAADADTMRKLAKETQEASAGWQWPQPTVNRSISQCLIPDIVCFIIRFRSLGRPRAMQPNTRAVLVGLIIL